MVMKVEFRDPLEPPVGCPADVWQRALMLSGGNPANALNEIPMAIKAIERENLLADGLPSKNKDNDGGGDNEANAASPTVADIVSDVCYETVVNSDVKIGTTSFSQTAVNKTYQSSVVDLRKDAAFKGNTALTKNAAKIATSMAITKTAWEEEHGIRYASAHERDDAMQAKLHDMVVKVEELVHGDPRLARMFEEGRLSLDTQQKILEKLGMRPDDMPHGQRMFHDAAAGMHMDVERSPDVGPLLSAQGHSLSEYAASCGDGRNRSNLHGHLYHDHLLQPTTADTVQLPAGLPVAAVAVKTPSLGPTMRMGT